MSEFSAYEQKKVRIVWNDAVLYGPKKKAEQLTSLETIGTLEKADSDYVIIGSPQTIRLSDKTPHPATAPTFYFIPRGMIKSIELH